MNGLLSTPLYPRGVGFNHETPSKNWLECYGSTSMHEAFIEYASMR